MNRQLVSSFVVAAATVAGLASSASAAPVSVVGAASFGAFGEVDIANANLSNPGVITLAAPFLGFAVGDYTPNIGTFLEPDPIVMDIGAGVVNPGGGFTITGPATFGTFVPTFALFILQTANNLDLYVEGVFTPGTAVGTQAGGCATGGDTCIATVSSLRMSFTQTGEAVSVSGTFNSPNAPPQVVPEPASLALLGAGLLAVVGFARRRRNQ